MEITTKPRLLVVEDDGLIRLDLADILADQGYAVDEAATADEALEFLDATDGIVAVLTDIDMPGSMNGIGFANVAYERWPEIKIVVISGRYNPAAGVLPPGAKFLSKPVSEQMIERVLVDVGVVPAN
ncbi:response regulator [Rhizobium sp. Root482]|uniref:response regulator n=1 Tax=Rhizobium sp. Root482 TaxID=1736543 RepID=UPI0007004BC1|nr:response regulator [Rhizobium sp. Root482]KQY23689.1 two-component system response regulator [Rhizobium sp. Root482]